MALPSIVEAISHMLMNNVVYYTGQAIEIQAERINPNGNEQGVERLASSACQKSQLGAGCRA